MTNILPFQYAVPQAVAPLEVTIAKRGNRWVMAFIEGDDVQPCAPMDVDDVPIISYVSDYFARVAVWAYARKWIAQRLTVVYRGDLETA